MRTSTEMISAEQALPGRPDAIVVDRPHLVFHTSLMDPPASDLETAYLAMGCFWGAERKFIELAGVTSTAVGYQGGFTANPTYQEVCTGRTGHAEVVRVVFDPNRVTYRQILQCFFENHDPTQGFRQGADIGTQYRSAIYYANEEQEATARDVLAAYGERLREAGYGAVTTELAPAGPFFLAEEYHQQYLVANPNGYCGLGGTGVSCPIGLVAP